MNNHFTVLVVGDNPQQLLDKYNSSKKVEKYIKYHYSDAKKLHSNAIITLETILKSPKDFGLNKDYQIDLLKEEIENLRNINDLKYYNQLTQDLIIDENGDAWSTKNPDGKWVKTNIGKEFAIPLILKNGDKTFQAKVKDVDWNIIHMNNTQKYDIVWQMIKEGKKPENETEKIMYNNMKNYTEYFNSFSNKEEYIIHNCAFWTYAFLDDKGWCDMDDSKSQKEWISTFFDRFIKKLSDNDTITIYECFKE